jgi:hypothetical protein
VHQADEDDAAYAVARRRVGRGEELTFDYNINTAGGTSWPCNCGAARCRGESIGDFFSLPREIQLEYLPLLADWFVRRHPNKIASIGTSVST